MGEGEVWATNCVEAQAGSVRAVLTLRPNYAADSAGRGAWLPGRGMLKWIRSQLIRA